MGEEPRQHEMHNISFIIAGAVLFSFVMLFTVFLYIRSELSAALLRALLFLYFLSLILVALRIYFIFFVSKFAKGMGFELTTPFYLQPKIEGTYRENWWEIHFVNKETGRSPSILRTYIKLQWHHKKEFDSKKLSKYANTHYKGSKIIAVKHISRGYKDYLLLKRAWYTFDKKKICGLMDFLLKIAKDAGTRNKRKPK